MQNEEKFKILILSNLRPGRTPETRLENSGKGFDHQISKMKNEKSAILMTFYIRQIV